MTESTMVERDDEQYRGLSPAAVDVARRRAAEDRDLLAELLRRGAVTRDFTKTEGVPGRVAFREDVESRVKPKVNLAIRPKKKRR